MIFPTRTISQVDAVVSIEDCTALCADQAGCVSVTHQPATSRCWLKNKQFGADPQDMAGVNSRNLICEGKLRFIFHVDPGAEVLITEPVWRLTVKWFRD